MKWISKSRHTRMWHFASGTEPITRMCPTPCRQLKTGNRTSCHRANGQAHVGGDGARSVPAIFRDGRRQQQRHGRLFERPCRCDGPIISPYRLSSV